ncbi:hypothetical protein CcCBS67573_g01756 [Chytriomyces confervae]|uniref:Exostosin GT47 domain-containing protein n=1 Tax=Chytriomyces confervae TaxID=246404 RepID=A0A507FL39_9FUNG|nr:hypothetical protein HDU80_004797 [Chytriomyces hyalinus]TPX76983.1 hypothetical protein CcCBS67573_g01756 [Chytriomyces confervae]
MVEIKRLIKSTRIRIIFIVQVVALVACFVVFANNQSSDMIYSDSHASFNKPVYEYGNFSYLDRLSSIDFKLISDHYYKKYGIPEQYLSVMEKKLITPLTRIERVIVKPGAVVYVDGGLVRQFKDLILPRIRGKIVLLTGDGDDSMPSLHLNVSETIELASNRKILHWYMSNCNGTHIYPSKMECMPVGVSQWHGHRENLQYAYENGTGLIHGLQTRPRLWRNRPAKYIMSSFTISSNRAVRQPALDYFCGDNSPNRRIRRASICSFNKDMPQYQLYDEYLSKVYFVVSPHGGGLDCYRTWETLYMGAIPIVMSSSLDYLYKDLPVLIIRSWEEVTEELLESTFNEFQRRAFDYRKLYMAYWRQKIFGHLV